MVDKNNKPLSNIKFEISKMLQDGYYGEADVNGRIEMSSLFSGKYCLWLAEPSFSSGSGYAPFFDFQIINSDVTLGKVVYDISLWQGCHF
jgi:hypothetical protein